MKSSSQADGMLWGTVAAILCEVIYGASYLFTKSVTNGVSAMTLLSWRFFTAFIAMSLLALSGAVKLRFRGKNFKKLLPITLCFPVGYYTLETVGIQLTTASESGVIIACAPVVTILTSAVLLRKKPLRQQVAGVLLTLLGVTLTTLVRGMEASFSPLGYLSLLAALLTYSIYSVSVEKATEFTGGELTYAMLAAGALVFTVLALIEHGTAGTLRELLTIPFRSLVFLAAMLYLSLLSSVSAFFLNNYAIRSIGTNATATYVGIVTVVSILLGVIVLREPFTAWQVVGVALILSGVYLANTRIFHRVRDKLSRA